ncbi:MAG: ribonuclease PH, partial [Vulcanimicrobiaceae bacterium]
ATSVGIVAGVTLLDLAYEEDSRAAVDMNVAMTDSGKFVEIQGTAEAVPFSRGELDALLNLAETGIRSLHSAQQAVLEPAGLATAPHAR